MPKGYMYILECVDGSYYTGSTKNLELRFRQHQNGKGAKYTRSRLPVKLIYFEEFPRIDKAFYREKQVQGWRRKKKEALIKSQYDKLPELSKNYTQHRPSPRSLRQAQEADSSLAKSGKPLAEPVEASDNPIPKSKQWKQ